MSNVALVFNGHCRTFCDHIVSLHRNIIDVCDCDVLISTWSNIDGGFSQDMRSPPALNKELINKLCSVKNFEKLTITAQHRHSEVKDISRSFRSYSTFPAKPWFLSAGLYARKLSSDMLKEHELLRGKPYDSIICMTMDNCVLTPIDNVLLSTKDTLFTQYPDHIKKRGIATAGRLVFGDRETMKFWLDMYDVFETYAAQVPQGVITMEKTVGHAILNSGIKFADAQISYDLVRMNGIRVRYDHTKPQEYTIKRNSPRCGC